MGLLDSMDFDHMDDTGMWVWASVLAAVGLVASFAIALWWQRWRDSQKKA